MLENCWQYFSLSPTKKKKKNHNLIVASQFPGARGKEETAQPDSLSLPGSLHVSDNIYEGPREWSTFVKIFLHEKVGIPCVHVRVV